MLVSSESKALLPDCSTGHCWVFNVGSPTGQDAPTTGVFNVSVGEPDAPATGVRWQLGLKERKRQWFKPSKDRM